MKPEPDDFLALTGVPCPTNFIRAFMRLEGMDEGEILELIIDDGEAIENVLDNLEEEEQDVFFSEQIEEGSWRLLVRRVED